MGGQIWPDVHQCVCSCGNGTKTEGICFRVIRWRGEGPFYKSVTCLRDWAYLLAEKIFLLYCD